MNLLLYVVTSHLIFAFEKKKKNKKGKAEGKTNSREISLKVKRGKNIRKERIEIRAKNFGWNDKTILFQP